MPRRSLRISSASQASSGLQSTSTVEKEETTPPFFNTVFATHSVSPLHVGSEGLTPARLQILSRRLRDTLVGDVVRGIQIGIEATDTPAGQVGPLRTVKVQWIDARSVLGEATHFPGDGNTWAELPDEEKRGLWIHIRHENAAYNGLLMPGADGLSPESTAPLWQMHPDQKEVEGSNRRHFMHLPLLLLKMPAPLKAVITEWLATTFDCRVSRLALGTKTITTIWEDWIRTVGVPSKGSDFVITLGFNVPLPDPDRSGAVNGNDDGDTDNTKAASTTSGLRSVDVMIQPKDLSKFLRAGKALKPRKQTAAAAWETDPRERRRLAGPNDDNGWAWRSEKESPSQPFIEALAAYLEHHLALNLFHPSVRVDQISCGGFTLGQSRIKMVQQGELTEPLSQAAWMFMTRLGNRIRVNNAPAVFS